jgi:hypothetical protein
MDDYVTDVLMWVKSRRKEVGKIVQIPSAIFDASLLCYNLIPGHSSSHHSSTIKTRARLMKFELDSGELALKFFLRRWVALGLIGCVKEIKR